MRKSFTYKGKRYNLFVKDDVEFGEKKAKKIREIDENILILDKNTTVKKWAEEWLETYKKPSVGVATYTNVKSIVNNYVLSEMGRLRLIDVKSTHLQKILNSMKGMSKSHITKAKQAIQQIFLQAYLDKLIQSNPAEHLKMPLAKDGSHRAITDKERKNILELAETHYSGLWVKVMLYCGLRPQETATLQWKDIDFKKSILSVTDAREAMTNEIKPPKSNAGTRKIPIPPNLLKDLLKAKKQPLEYVFAQPTTGRRHTQSSMRCLWSSFKRDLNIKMGTKVYRNQLMEPFMVADDLTPYCLRHTYCTDLQTAGVPINVAKELMGHSDISVTSKIYTHFSDESFNSAAELLNEFHTKQKAK